ncbi:SIS domain-containing protein [Lacrimispora sp. 210928-DFI.3.58]|uniref:SIS domain-containing protein n=1 Tax=Lacrimispora sp. 210928-DFI.3.58 TaxID=2883214 RepID=UPI0015B4781B|nr:SIS domain-containing protein [Lacrimispora sp. 210928-DFI.3.58]MCB7318792.1 SIS domain-containing protein [Lacrimispora sp. 210928-DFI.3.58]
MNQFDNAMRRQAMSLPELLRQQYEDLEPKTRSILSFEEIFSIQKIVLTGCGDSHAAAMATKYTFEQLTGVPTEVVPALDLSRYYADSQLGFAPRNPLVIAVSNSGTVARVGEAIQRAVKAGAFALGVTGNRESLLGKSVSRILDLAIPKQEGGPGVRSYLVSVLALLLLAIRFGEVRGRFTMDQANAYRRDLLRQADELEQLLPRMDEEALKMAQEWKEMEAFDFVGAGTDYAAAWYGHAKAFEADGAYAMCINAEEWLHLNFFLRKADRTGTVVVCSKENRGLVRVREMVKHAADDMGRPTWVLTDDPGLFGDTKAKTGIFPSTAYSFSASLTNFIPCALLAGYINVLTGEEYGRGCKGPWSFADQGAGIINSEIVLD